MSIDRGVDKDVVHVYNAILPSHKKNEIMPFAATWMDLKSVILNHTKSEREGEILYGIPYLWNLKRNDTNGLKKQTH